jgi:hypothetical protein
VYDLQDSMSLDVWKLLVDDALDFMAIHGGKDQEYNGNTDGDAAFASKWNKVKAFRDFDTTPCVTTKKKAASKFQAPVLTRWWTVGDAAQTLFECYLLLLKVSQSVINSTGGKSNKIASGLQPLLLEPEIYSDLTLISCYHASYVLPHFGWMQAATDLSGVPGFQSHNTLARYFLLQSDLKTMKATIATDHPSFQPFQESLPLLSPLIALQQASKVDSFISLALDACHKHFKRWMSKDLLPAAMLSEQPLAAIVARIILEQPPKEAFDPPEHASQVHKRSFVLLDFQEFIASGIDVGNVYEPMTLHVAQLLLEGVDMRDMTAPTVYQAWMYSTYLPLASHTQFVEAGVKEAKIVSQSDRSEQLRSSYAINRSARVHSAADKPLRELRPTEREWNAL